MNFSSNLKRIKNENLISDLKDLISKEREITTKTLHYLREVEIRKIHLEKGYSSLFAYMTEGLGYSEGAAQRRIQAMRLIKDIPEVEKKIKSGAMSLTVASHVQGFIQRENKKRKVEKSTKLTSNEKLDLVHKLEGTSSRTCEKKLAEISPETGIPKDKTRILTPKKTLIQFVADEELMKMLNKIKELTSHQNPQGEYGKLFTKMAQITLDKLDPQRRAQRREKRSTQIHRTRKAVEHLEAKRKHSSISVSPLPGIPKNPGGRGVTSKGAALGSTQCLPPAPAVKVKKRYIPQKLRDWVWIRDKNQCQFKNRRTGKVCGSKKLLEIDHKFPFALGGGHFEGNLQLRCRSHNQYRTEELFSGVLSG